MDNVFEAGRAGIEILDVEEANKEPEFLAKVLARAARHVGDRTVITIHPTTRTKEGWIEWVMVIQYYSAGKLYIACIERTKGAEMECHS